MNRHPSRGDAEAYARYLRGMDASMQQKVALTAAFFLAEGRIADMGSGSGSATRALAALYPRMSIVGVDLDLEMARTARTSWELPNLEYIAGDISAPPFGPRTLDGVLLSSVLHHVTTFGGYRYRNAADTVAAQVSRLRDGGVIVIRDFVAPRGGEILLRLRSDDGDEGDDPRTCSTSALFERFAREFRLLSDNPGFEYRAEPSPEPGWRQYRVDRRMATEFVLRKDYRQDWEKEVLEEYLYFTQEEFERELRALGLRILSSTPIRNPWIVRNRFEGRFTITDRDGRIEEMPPTNFIIAAERTGPRDGVDFHEVDEVQPRSYLLMEHFRHRGDGSLRDLVRRPHRTIDVVPWFRWHGEIFVLARTSYPRPILRSGSVVDPLLDGSSAIGYVVEPLNLLQTDAPLAQTVETALAEIRIADQMILGLEPGVSYLPSPGGVLEEVTSVLVEIEASFAEMELPKRNAYSTSGRLRPIEARQLLRAAQVGGLADARLELNVYELLSRLRLPLGPWLGDALDPIESEPFEERRPDPPPRRRMFQRADQSAGFLDLRCLELAEVASDGSEIFRDSLELVAPRRFSTNTVSVALLRWKGTELWLGIDEDDLPAAQSIHGSSALLVVPAWRVPRSVSGLLGAQSWLRDMIRREYGISFGRLAALGGRYHPSPGVTPETVFPMVASVTGEQSGERRLRWVAVTHLAGDFLRGADGHLRITAARIRHATVDRNWSDNIRDVGIRKSE